jgi:sulfite reductase alpha subunit-like flavoprotein
VTPEDYEKQILHMEIDISGSNIEYKPGDAFGVLAENSPELVDTLLARLGVNNGNGASREFETSEQINSIKTPCSVRDAFMKYCDITSPPKKSLLRLLAESCKKEEDKVKLLEMISAKGKATYRKDILEGEPNLLDILETYPSCKPKLEDLIEFLPALAPRLYSVSSTREVHQDQVHFAFSLVEFKTSYKNKGNVRRGVATSWLCRMADLVQDGWTVHIPIFLKPSRDFQHPKVEDLTKPIIMIGPGTGVSPFRGFLHYRGFLEQQQQQETTTKSKAGESWLFYGCRDRTKDFLYEKDFTMLHEEKKVLHHYQTAFSREQSTKVYVQHLMENNKEKLGQLILEEGAYIFVCGDGMHMAKDVQNKLNEILCKQGKMTAIDADKMLKDMLKSGRYVRDIWS